jgi:1-acyl-sn-glycerol-3-phosphate acyltransferase
MKLVILSIIIWIISVITIIIILPVYFVFWALTVLFDKKLILAHYAVSLWASIYTILNPFWDISIENRQKFKRNKPYVIVSNHQSLLDILILFRLFRHFRWVSKTENFRIPVVGWIMSLNKYIEITRGDKKSIARMMETCKNKLKSGISILMFPEGTRSINGNLGGFKDGAFILAIETQTDILPVVLDGAAKAIPKNTLLLSKRQKITMKILDEIPASGFMSGWKR